MSLIQAIGGLIGKMLAPLLIFLVGEDRGKRKAKLEITEKENEILKAQRDNDVSDVSAARAHWVRKRKRDGDK